MTLSRAAVLTLLLAGTGFNCSDATEPARKLQVTLSHISMNCQPTSSLARRCAGTVDLNFSPTQASGKSYFVVLNTGNINGTGSSNGSAVVRFVIGGDVFSCPFTNPSDLIVYDGASQSGSAIATIEFNWTSGTLCSNW